MPHTRIALMAACALVLASTTVPLQAQQTPPAPEAAAPVMAAQAAENADSKKNRYERRICKSTAPTGTRIAKKTCLTQAQWEEAQRVGQDATDKAQTSSLMINKQGN